MELVSVSFYSLAARMLRANLQFTHYQVNSVLQACVLFTSLIHDFL